jgi:hypothetical protein
MRRQERERWRTGALLWLLALVGFALRALFLLVFLISIAHTLFGIFRLLFPFCFDTWSAGRSSVSIRLVSILEDLGFWPFDCFFFSDTESWRGVWWVC